MPPGFAISLLPPASLAEANARLESALLDLSDLAVPVRLLKDAEALLGDWFTAERAAVKQSPAPALYRAIETLSRLTAVRKTLIALAKALMEPPRPPAPPKPALPNPAKPAIAQESSSSVVPPSGNPDSSSFVVPPLGGPNIDNEEPTDCETDPANPAATQSIPSISSTPSTQAAQPANLLKLSFSGIHPPAPNHDSTALAPSPGSGTDAPPTQPKRGPLIRSSAEIVRQVQSCPRLATLSTKILERNINGFVRLKAALAYARPVPKPGEPTPAPSRHALEAQNFSFHSMPPNQLPASPPADLPDPPDSS